MVSRRVFFFFFSGGDGVCVPGQPATLTLNNSNDKADWPPAACPL